MKKPDYYTLEIKLALHELREANIINMFLAGSFLMSEFNLSEKQADNCVLYWITTQCENLNREQRTTELAKSVKITE